MQVEARTGRGRVGLKSLNSSHFTTFVGQEKSAWDKAGRDRYGEKLPSLVEIL